MPKLKIYHVDNFEKPEHYDLCKKAMEQRGDKMLRIEWTEQKKENYIAAEIISEDDRRKLSAVYYIYHDDDGRFIGVQHQWTRWLRFKKPEIAEVVDFGSIN